MLDERTGLNLIPHFIHQEYQANRFRGKFTAATMFLDISGFTPMTQALMQHGKQGAETLSAILNRVFHPVIYAIYDRGGFISGYAGDAFTALFPLDKTSLAPLHAAQAIQQIFAQYSLQQTPLGAFSLAVKIGLSMGEVEWGIIGPPPHKTYFFRGPGIDHCAQAEHQAQQGEIVLDHTWLAMLPPGAADTLPLKNNYAKLTHLRSEATFEQPSQPASFFSPIPFFSETLLPIALQGEFRDVVNIFVSFKNVAGPEQSNAFVTQVIETIDRFGGYFNRLDFGDKGCNVLILLGAPIAYENVIERALAFLLTLQTDLRNLSDVNDLTWRAGVSFGLVYTGMIGIPLRCEYTALGDGVNLAARLMMKADWGQILTSEAIAKHPAFKFQYLGDFQYKGFTNAVSTYALLGEKLAREKIFGQAMVGRQAELQQLVTTAQPIFQGRFAGVAYIYGEPGIGKSRLSYELRNALGQGARANGLKATSPWSLHPVAWFTAQTDQTLRQTFNPFTYFLKRYFSQAPELSADQNKVFFEQRLDQLLTELTDVETGPGSLSVLQDELTRLKSILGALIGLRWTNSLYETLDAKGRYENTLLAVKTLLLAESRLRPVVFELEDGHWLDEASHELLTSLTHNIADYPLFIVSTLRYGDDGSRPTFNLASNTPTTAIDLKVLSPVDGQILAKNVLKGLLPIEKLSDFRIDNALYTLLLEKTQANPFYLQQFLYYLNENNFLGVETSEALAAPTTLITLKATPSDLPTTVNAILIARIDRLAENIKEVVKVASVLGREFEVRVLSQLLREDIGAEVQRAVAEQIWSSLTELRYIFNHALLRDAAYEMQLRARLRELHRLAGESYEQLYAANLAPYYAELAYHYGQAQATEKEWFYAKLAGEQAAARFANTEAIHYLRRAIELLPSLPETSEYIQEEELALQTRLGYLLMNIRGYGDQEVEAAYRRAHELAMQAGDSAQLGSILYGLFSFYASRGEYRAATPIAEQLLALGQRLNDRKVTLVGHNALAVVSVLRGNLAKGERHADACITIADTDNDPSLFNLYGGDFRGYPRSWVSTAQCLLGFPEKAQATFNKALELTQDHPYTWGFVRCFSALTQIKRDYSQTQQRAQELLQIAGEYNFPILGVIGGLQQGWAMAAGQGNPEGVAMIEQSLPILRYIKLDSFNPFYLAQYAEALAATERLAQALNTVDEAFQLIDPAQGHFYEAELYRLKGELLLAQGAPPAEAEWLFNHALEIGQRQGAKWWELRVAVSLGQLLKARGDKTVAGEMLAKIYASFSEGFDTPDLKAAKTLLDELVQT